MLADEHTRYRYLATIIYTALGRDFVFRGGHVFARSEEDVSHMIAFLEKVPKLVQDGVVKPLPVKVWEGGLNAISDGLQWMREGNVSAQKIVYHV